MTEALQTLIGKKVDTDVPTKELEKMAKKAGYTRCQLRNPSDFFDAQYDTKRLQVHVDENNKIVDLREG